MGRVFVFWHEARRWEFDTLGDGGCYTVNIYLPLSSNIAGCCFGE